MAGEVSIDVEVRQNASGASPEQLQRAVDLMNSMALYVGIPEGSGGSGGLNNVQLAYLMSNGSPVNKMPARPFIEPAIEQEDVMNNISEQFAQAFDAAMQGDRDGIFRALSYAGIYGSNAVKAYMGSGALAPNAPITINGGWMRNKVSGKPVYVKGKGSAAPLIDTGSLRASVTYVIKGDGE